MSKKVFKIEEKLVRHIVVDVDEDVFETEDVIEDIDDMCGGGQIDLDYNDFAGRTIEVVGDANKCDLKNYDNYRYTDGGLM